MAEQSGWHAAKICPNINLLMPGEWRNDSGRLTPITCPSIPLAPDLVVVERGNDGLRGIPQRNLKIIVQIITLAKDSGQKCC